MNVELLLSASTEEETPLAVVDETAMELNLKRMARTALTAGVQLRPHAKTHKSLYVGGRQLEHGAIGLAVATLSEAEAFADAGVDDLLLVHPPVGRAKLQRLAAVSERVSQLAVSLDDVDLAAMLPVTVDVLWEVDSGHHRVGTQPGEATANSIMSLLDVIAAERFRGLLTFPGHAYAAIDVDSRRRVALEAEMALRDSVAALERRGIQVGTLSNGSTPTAAFTRSLIERTEIRPGAYVYGDVKQVSLGSATLDDCALAVVATVVSTPARDRAVIDAGSKALSTDMQVEGLNGHGLIAGREDLRLARLSEEHGVITADRDTGLAIGDRVAVIPTHCCTTVNLHPAVLFVREHSSHREPVAARGWAQEGDT